MPDSYQIQFCFRVIILWNTFVITINRIEEKQQIHSNIIISIEFVLKRQNQLENRTRGQAIHEASKEFWIRSVDNASRALTFTLKISYSKREGFVFPNAIPTRILQRSKNIYILY